MINDTASVITDHETKRFTGFFFMSVILRMRFNNGAPLAATAHFDAERPTLPRGWDHWDFWQYTVTQVGVVPSIPGRVDLDYYCGDLAEFEAEFKRDPMDEIREQLRVIEEALARIRTLMP